MKLKALVVLLVVCSFFLPLTASLAEDDVCIPNEDLEFVISEMLVHGDLLDMIYYTDPRMGVDYLRITNQTFDELCKTPNIQATISRMISSTDDDLNMYVLRSWLNGLDTDEYTFSRNSVLFTQLSLPADYTSVTYTTPNGRVVNMWKYIGNATPPSTIPSQYSDCTLLGQGSYYYNCFSYAWYYLGNISGVSNSSFRGTDDPSGFYSSSLLSRCAQVVSSLRPGDIIQYHACPCQDSKLVHSAIVTSGTGTNLNNITCKSKWGYGPLVSHSVYQCPYYTGQHQVGQDTCPGYSFVFYRLNHRMTHYAYYNALYHKVSCYCCGRKSYTESHSYEMQSNGFYVCTGCNHRTSTIIEPYNK